MQSSVLPESEEKLGHKNARRKLGLKNSSTSFRLALIGIDMLDWKLAWHSDISTILTSGKSWRALSTRALIEKSLAPTVRSPAQRDAIGAASCTIRHGDRRSLLPSRMHRPLLLLPPAPNSHP